MADSEPQNLDPESAESHKRLAQVRDLLFGETARGLDERVERLAQGLAQVERKFEARTTALDERLQALGETSVDRQALAQALRALADTIESKATAKRSS